MRKQSIDPTGLIFPTLTKKKSAAGACAIHARDGAGRMSEQHVAGPGARCSCYLKNKPSEFREL
ncbi:MAG: hypothetical protein C4520_16700 [Candidatus Abyssobacteria bacterium SURF_5]|uniref:Uncharacterized protein n=1 Tax=Abyssobacteria bacterium (strain SURF_5) TaxID=2093360 RepID=A0A3A4ND60_ABYX5|nr:MAG: hypothetical protein C4520_16700 [Candidatus Abyssubacteria bacterium SURF_5]